MDDLIVRSLMAETTAEEERQLMRWRAAAPENDARYRSLSATWELAGQALSLPEREPPSAASLIDRIEREAARESSSDRSRDPSRWFGSVPGRALAVAAGLAAITVLGILMRPTTTQTPPAAAPYAIVADQPRTAHLADGSAVHLDSGSTLVIDPAAPRSVWLEGRAYFGVAHQPGEPFLVRSDAGQTRVLGTRFDLAASEDELTVVVVEGRVAVQSDSGEAEVGPGEESRVVRGGSPTVAPADMRTARAWLGNVFIFQSTPLAVVAGELEAYFDRTIVLEDPALAERTVTAVFTDRSLEELLPALCRAVAAECVDRSDTVLITL